MSWRLLRYLPNEVEIDARRYSEERTVSGQQTTICRWRIWCSTCRPLDETEYHTIAGLLMEYLQRIPQTGEEVRWAIIAENIAGRNQPSAKFGVPLRITASRLGDVTSVPCPRPAWAGRKRR